MRHTGLWILKVLRLVILIWLSITNRLSSIMVCHLLWCQKSHSCQCSRNCTILVSSVRRLCQCGLVRVRRSSMILCRQSPSTSCSTLRVRQPTSSCQRRHISSLIQIRIYSSYWLVHGNSKVLEVRREKNTGWWEPSSCRITTQSTISRTRK